MKIDTDWKLVLRHAWSVRLVAVAAILSGLEIALPVVQDYLPFPPVVVSLLLFAVVCGAFIARFVAQEKLGAS